MGMISGSVLVRETGAGVPDLVVAAYHHERSAMPFESDGFTPLAVLQIGRRIGSVLTNVDGRFALRYEDSPSGERLRLDISLVVFAPEDVQGPHEPYSVPPAQRVLYVSTVSRQDAGVEEAFVIRLLQEQLDRFRISSTSTAGHGLYDSERLAQAIKSRESLQDALQEKLKPRLRQEHDENTALRNLALDKVKTLSAIPLHLRLDNVAGSRFLISDRGELASSLRQKQDEAVADGLMRMSQSPVRCQNPIRAV